MPKYKVMVGRPAVNGTERTDIGNWLFQLGTITKSDPELIDLIDDVLLVPIAQVPTSVARNRLVHLAQQNKVDVLFMIDDDCQPHDDFFKRAMLFLITQPAAAMIGSPYVCGGTQQRVQVFEFQSPNNHGEQSFALQQIHREDAALRKGIQGVAAIGTHFVAYKMCCFDAIKKPYYDYEYNDDKTKVMSTEEIPCHRRMYFAGVKIYCDWDCWSGHYKMQLWDKPYVLSKKDIDGVYLEKAAALLRAERQHEDDVTARE